MYRKTINPRFWDWQMLAVVVYIDASQHCCNACRVKKRSLGCLMASAILLHPVSLGRYGRISIPNFFSYAPTHSLPPVHADVQRYLYMSCFTLDARLLILPRYHGPCHVRGQSQQEAAKLTKSDDMLSFMVIHLRYNRNSFSS